MSYFYVICPVGADPDFRPKADIVRDLCEAYSLQAFFPLERRSELSIDQACSDMKRAAFVLADLSLERPSCYFELGIAETLGVRVFLIAATGTPIHQVGKTRKVAFYSDLTQYRSNLSDIVGPFSAPARRHNVG